jgi:hypothetical protein
MAGLKEMAGRRFGRLNVICRAADPGKRARWLCQCDCGNVHIVAGSTLRNSRVQSCGCLFKATNGLRHNKSFTPEYAAWKDMRYRCENPNSHAWKGYGGRGIKVCERWQNFENFYIDMGPRPLGMTLDRINNDGNYEPGNCRWTTRKEQRLNQRKRAKRDHGSVAQFL